MKNIKKLLVSVMVLTALSLTSFALPGVVTVGETAEDIVLDSFCEEPQLTLMGDGSEESPYEISSTVEFNNYASLIKSSNSEYGSKYYKLTGNVDFSDAVLVPFGTSTYPFTGTFDGNGYSLYNVSINNVECSGVIGYMTAGTVKNLSVSYKDMTSRESFSTLKYFGGIVGNVMPASAETVIIEGCSTDGDIVLYDSSTVYAGGIIGRVKAENGNLSATNCVSHMSFDLQTVSNSYAGGFVSYASAASSKDYIFKNCVSFGDVKLISNGVSSNAAGFAGYVNKDESGWSGWASDEEAELAATTYHFESCAALGNVYSEATKNVYVGGFIGKVGGQGTINKSNIYRNASQTVAGGVGTVTVNTLATEAALETLKTEAFYSDTLGFDFTNIWYMSDADDVPALRTVAKAFGGSDVSDTKDIRLSETNAGLRFRASIETFKRDYCFEYGFIVARKDELGEEELTFDFTGRMINGIAYDSETDLFLEMGDETIIFTGVVYNIPQANYDVELVARAYVKFVCDGETVILYGNTTSSSINESAQAIKNSESYGFLSDEQKDILETMLPTA